MNTTNAPLNPVPPSPPKSGGNRDFLGVTFDTMSQQAVLRRILDQAKASPFEYVVTPNVAHMVAIVEGSKAIADLYKHAWLCLNDSRVLRRIAKLTHAVDLPVYPGSDLTRDLLSLANHQSLSVTVIGAHADDAKTLNARYPNLSLSYFAAPRNLKDSHEARQQCVDFVVSSDADLVLIAVGMPQQEMIAADIAATGAARGVGLCIGASIDFLTLRQIRAPRWMQKLGIEWLHRLLSDPQRLARRYLIDCPKILMHTLRDRARQKS